MTVSTEVTRVIVEGNGVTTSFAYSFPIPGVSLTDQTNAELILTDSAGTSTTLADNLWSLTGVVVTTPIDGTASGTFIYPLTGSPVSTGNFLTLNRIVPYEQETTLTGQGAYSPAVVETALDNLALQTEQNNTRLLQSLRVPITDAAISDYPPVAQRAGGFAGFDPVTGDALVLFGTPGSAIFVGTNSTSTSSVTTLLLTGNAVSSVTTASGVATATLTSAIDITDATHTVSAATTLTFLNGTVGGSNPNATYTAPASGGGGWVFLNKFTGSATSSLACTGFVSATYNVYAFVIEQASVATSTDDFVMQIGTGGTPTYDTGNNYEWVQNGLSTGASAQTNAGSSVAFCNVFKSMSNNAGYGYGTAQFYWHQFNSTSTRKYFHGTAFYVNSGPTAISMQIGGDWLTTATAVTAIRFITSGAGNLSANVYVYGLQKS